MSSGGPDTADDDRAFVAGLRRGEPAAFDRVYARHHARVHRFLLRLSGRRDTAEDLAQETWLRFARSASSLAEDTRLAPWIFTIARNAFVSHRRWALLDLSRLVTMGAEMRDAAARAPSPSDPDAAHERARSVALLEAALAKLPVASREVLLLVGVEGLDQEEVARMLGVSYAALRQRLSRARAQLATTMADLDRTRSRPARRAAPSGEPA